MRSSTLVHQILRGTPAGPAGTIRYGRIHARTLGVFMHCSLCHNHENHPDGDAAKFAALTHNAFDHDGELEVIDDTAGRRHTITTPASPHLPRMPLATTHHHAA